MGIEKKIELRTKQIFKKEMASGKSYLEEQTKLSQFLADRQVNRPTQITRNLIKEYRQQELTPKDQQYIDRMFSEDKLNRLEKQNQKEPGQKPLRYQLADRMQELNRIGESKYEVKMQLKKYAQENQVYVNPLKNDGIYSHNTFGSYQQTSIEFEKYLRERHPEVKNIGDITKDHAKEYLLFRQAEEKSKWTVDKDMAALNKVLNMDLTKKEVGLQRKFYHESTRSRGAAKMDQKYNPENYVHQIALAKASGIRRQSMLKIAPKDFVKDPNGNITGITVKEKGGKIRTATILESKQKEITTMVEQLVKVQGEEAKLFKSYTSKIDNHSFRGEYARNLYQELVENQGMDHKDYQGYDKKILQEVSKNLGHERITVVIHYYLR